MRFDRLSFAPIAGCQDDAGSCAGTDEAWSVAIRISSSAACGCSSPVRTPPGRPPRFRLASPRISSFARTRAASIHRSRPSRMRREMRRPLPQDGRHHLHRVRARQHRFDPVVWRGHAAGDHERRPTRPWRIASHRSRSSSSALVESCDVRRRFHRRGVDVRLVEAVEQHEPSAPASSRRRATLAKRRENGETFTAMGIFRYASTRRSRATADARPPRSRRGSRRRLVHVQLDGAGAGLLDQAREGEPRFGRGAR